MQGYPGGIFKPEKNTTRAEFAKIICLAKGWNLIKPQTASFNDVSNSHWAYQYVETANNQGVMIGYDHNRFNPSSLVTRAEVAKIMAQTMQLPFGEFGFKDIAGCWAKPYIEACAKSGVVSGYDNGEYRPTCCTSRAEAAKIVSALVN